MEKEAINNRFIEAVSNVIINNKTTKADIASALSIEPSKFSEILNKRMNVGVELIVGISDKFDISLEWLLKGIGTMFESKDKSKIQVSPSFDTRPRIPYDAAAGSLSVALGSVTSADCEQLPVIPNFPRYDFTILARGCSMEPQYLSGDELACLFVTETSFIQWGRTHVLDTSQGIVVKRIFDNGDSILCKSNNPEFPDFSILKSEIYRIALVVGHVRIE